MQYDVLAALDRPEHQWRRTRRPGRLDDASIPAASHTRGTIVGDGGTPSAHRVLRARRPSVVTRHPRRRPPGRPARHGLRLRLAIATSSMPGTRVHDLVGDPTPHEAGADQRRPGPGCPRPRAPPKCGVDDDHRIPRWGTAIGSKSDLGRPLSKGHAGILRADVVVANRPRTARATGRRSADRARRRLVGTADLVEHLRVVDQRLETVGEERRDEQGPAVLRGELDRHVLQPGRRVRPQVDDDVDHPPRARSAPAWSPACGATWRCMPRSVPARWL